MNINQRMFSAFHFITNKPQRLGVVLLFGENLYSTSLLSLILSISFSFSLILSPKGFGFCVFSLITGIALGLFDIRAAKIVKRKKGEGTVHVHLFICFYYYYYYY